MADRYLFTSESVSEGHPDKLADQISDVVLDACLQQDAHARVACETYIRPGLVLVGGEIATSATLQVEELVRGRLRAVGYRSAEWGLDANECVVLNMLSRQSPDIQQGVDRAHPEDQGAGDQGVMFGYATTETPELMPAPILYAHRLMEQQASARKQQRLPWLRPDAKSQVTFLYERGVPLSVEAVVLSTQHAPEIPYPTLQEGVIEEIIRPVLSDWLHPATKFLINPTGRFVVGGPMAGPQGMEEEPFQERMPPK
eukprot:Blabericola_migrator_1__9168@NODE_4902_length_940_cov_2_562428_g3072_i0_p1_GENE_NODE_4902_length_940_cov_2_562428_g3072_i0NODE_4902_length_940_cov_2_562428_g3072_i0_p1_ORF_typecomplete_len256_score18_60SAdoMet_synt_M/PF02772_16/1_8e03SAdoMet_synt_M/PF02772_16/1_1e43SAdoMet_synt_N/PF00438_20/3_1e36DUF2497/PF10691_9/1_6e03DUF2497/PF10691_9/0_1AdoMet_Synthase/PF01941_19/3_1_NODE_4902_length_940_cov_2_562428_g3072_i06773